MKTLADTILQVKQLLALSKSSNANEAAAAASAANKLIDKYRLVQADLETEENFKEPIVQDSDYLYKTGRVTMWKNKLVYVLTRHYGVAYWNEATYPNGRKVSGYKMIGRKSDMEIVRYMYNWLSLECDRLATEEAKGKVGRVFVASYQDGFVAGISEQLRLSREAMKAESTCTAMVLIDGRYDESQATMYKIIPGLRASKSYSHSRFNGQAYDMGKQRGQEIHLGSSLGIGVRALNK